MAVKLITNGLVSGALQAICNYRWLTATTLAAYADEANVASAIATEVLAINAASGAPLADADNLQVGEMCQAICSGVFGNRNPTSIVAADYLTISTPIYAAAKQAEPKLVAPGATSLIYNGFVCGAAGALADERWFTATPAASYTTLANVAESIGDECLIANAALTVPMADADNTEIGQLCYSAAYGVLAGRNPTSIIDADYAAIATAIVNIAKQCASKLIAPGPATKVIQNSFVNGAVAALCKGRWLNQYTLASYADEANVARAIADQCITANAALLAPMIDADNTEISYLCQAGVFGVLAGRNPTSIVATDYATIATAIVNIIKATVSKLV